MAIAGLFLSIDLDYPVRQILPFGLAGVEDSHVTPLESDCLAKESRLRSQGIRRIVGAFAAYQIEGPIPVLLKAFQSVAKCQSSSRLKGSSDADHKLPADVT